jgi:hypothetical protein
MDKEAIEKRLAEINKHIEQSMANINMLMGGREECTYWLKLLNGHSNPSMSEEELKKVLGADSLEVI